MWPFNQKKKIVADILPDFETVLCIPGTWQNWEEFILRIAATTEAKYLAIAEFLIDTQSNCHYSIDFQEYDGRMQDAFKYAGAANQVSDEFITNIGKHKHVIYISGTGGSFRSAENIARAGQVVLNSGGLGIKIETAGKAFEKDQWESYLENFETASLFDMFVIGSIYDADRNASFSCGMQNLGFKDTVIYGGDFQESVKVIRIFSFYQIVDDPILRSGETFSPFPEYPRFEIAVEPNQPYEEDDMFRNPFGMWRLTKIQ